MAATGRDRLGEGPVWDAALGELLWVDIMGHAVNRLNLVTGGQGRLCLGEPVGWIIPRKDRSDYIIGLASGFATLDLSTGEVAAIGAPEPELPDNRMNDAKVDRWGRIWAGTKSDADAPGAGSLYMLDTDFVWHQMDSGYDVTNGPTFSLDGMTMYHTDSAARIIYAFDFRMDGSIGDRRIWLRFEDEWGYPDGMTTDADGCIWIAHWDGARISRFSPDGQLMRSIVLPARNITSCTFAGPKLDRMFVTSSTIGQEHDPYAGALFEVFPDAAGIEQPCFGG
jgi:sugar lactone lactonase YvrE